MEYYSVPSNLQDIIESIWHFESPTLLAKDEQAIVIPSGKPVLLWNYKGSYYHVLGDKEFYHPLFDLHIVGQHNSKIQIRGNEPVHSIGVVFRPYGLYAIMGNQLKELKNTIISLPKKDSNLNSYDGNPQLKVEAIIKYIEGEVKYKPDSTIIHLINQINDQKGNVVINELFAPLKASQRYLNQLFKKQIGLTPKEYASIIRFHEIYNAFLREKNEEKRKELYNLYYDDSHFIKHFKKIIKEQPKEFLKKQNIFGNHFIKK